jgi:hypothetical protein
VCSGGEGGGVAFVCVNVHRFRLHDGGMACPYSLLCLIYGVCVLYY